MSSLCLRCGSHGTCNCAQTWNTAGPSLPPFPSPSPSPHPSSSFPQALPPSWPYAPESSQTLGNLPLSAPPAGLPPPPFYHYTGPPGPSPTGLYPYTTPLFLATNSPIPPGSSQPPQAQPAALSTGNRSGRGSGKHRATEDRSSAPKRRHINENANTPVSTSAVVGVGPLVSPETGTIPEHVIETFASVKSSSASDGGATGAHDVWFFFRPLESKEEPAEKPSPESEETLLSKPKSPWIGCKLCKYVNIVNSLVYDTHTILSLQSLESLQKHNLWWCDEDVVYAPQEQTRAPLERSMPHEESSPSYIRRWCWFRHDGFSRACHN